MLVAVFSAACVQRIPYNEPRPTQTSRKVTLNGYPVTLHLPRPATTARLALLIYATGDGGWRGKDLVLFGHLTSWGYPIAGFSAPEYVKHLSGDAETTTPARLARDYEAVMTMAKQSLMLPAATAGILARWCGGA